MNPEKVTSSCYFENHWIKRLDYEAIICLRIKKKSAKKIVSMIGCMSHTEKAVSSCYIGSYWVVRFDCEDINCLEYKINWKKSLHHRMYESSRKRYIIMLSGKYRFSRLDNEDITCLESKQNQQKKLIFMVGCMSQPEKGTSSCYLGYYWFLRLELKSKIV